MFAGGCRECTYVCVCVGTCTVCGWGVKKIEDVIMSKALFVSCLCVLCRVEVECVSASRSQKCKVGRGIK